VIRLILGERRRDVKADLPAQMFRDEEGDRQGLTRPTGEAEVPAVALAWRDGDGVSDPDLEAGGLQVGKSLFQGRGSH
jgi:hypothetical protein